MNRYAFDTSLRKQIDTEFKKVFASIKNEPGASQNFLMLGLLPVDTAVDNSAETPYLDYFNDNFKKRRLNNDMTKENVAAHKKQLFSLYLRCINNSCLTNKFYVIHRNRLGRPIVQTIDISTGNTEKKTIYTLKADLLNKDSYSSQELEAVVQYQLNGLARDEWSFFYPICMEDPRFSFGKTRNNILYTIVGVVKHKAPDAHFLKELIQSVSTLDQRYAPVTLPIFRRALLVQNIKFISASVKSAIGAIMSRNGSHNIGSHVLSALSHNVGTMPDDRVLYQYIQHRMDYIATATTDFPAWNQPTMFLSNMMKTLLSQRHLLDNIAGSEGLKAWKFQGRNTDKKSNVATIKFRIRKKLEGGTTKNLLEYGGTGGALDLGSDISLAIPGGTVGQHAFFTIIENIIRNAAKHDWSSPPKKTRRNKFSKSRLGDETIMGNLEVFIDFEDLPQEGNVEFTIFTNMSDADEKIIHPSGQTTLLHHLEKTMDMPFIDENGNLRRENWGIAEMKISAGYLQGRNPGEIGGLKGIGEKDLDNDARFGNIIMPVKVPMGRINHLGYKFKIPKSRTLIVVVKDKPVSLDAEKAKTLARFGITIKSETEASSAKADNSAEFLLMDSFTQEQLGWRLPFRIVCTNPESCCERTKGRVAKWIDSQYGLRTTDDIAIALAADSDTEGFTNYLFSQIAAVWTQHLKKTRGIIGPLNLVVSPEINKPNSSGQSLVNASAVVKFVFEEGITKAKESFESFMSKLSVNSSAREWRETSRAMTKMLILSKGLEKRLPCGMHRRAWKRIDSAMAEALYFFNNTKERLTANASDKERKETKSAIEYILNRADSCEIDESVIQSEEGFRQLIVKQIALWLHDDLKNSIPSVLAYVKEQLKGPRERDIADTTTYINHPFKLFVDYLVEVCKQAKKYLGQYAEEIATLPSGFNGDYSPQKSLHEHNLLGSSSEDWTAAGLKVYIGTDVPKDGEIVQYYRHYKPTAGRSTLNEPPPFVTSPFQGTGNLYIEPLSGTQSYISQLKSLSVARPTCSSMAARKLLLAKLTECALLRILIIDERVSSFVKSHSDLTLATFALMNISVVDDKEVTDELESKMEQKAKSAPTNLSKSLEYTLRGLVKLHAEGIETLRNAVKENGSAGMEDLGGMYHAFKDRFDVLIVHQGILDKWFPNVVSDMEKMSELYNVFKKVFPYVVITTGRGTPANIPDMARVLPFSTIEATLFKKYPEKLVLVDAIMNILPIKTKQ